MTVIDCTVLSCLLLYICSLTLVALKKHWILFDLSNSLHRLSMHSNETTRSQLSCR